MPSSGAFVKLSVALGGCIVDPSDVTFFKLYMCVYMPTLACGILGK